MHSLQFDINNRVHNVRGTGWHSWLRHRATNRKVAGSLPGCAIGISHRRNSVGRTMALGSTQLLTEIITGNSPWRLKVVRRADNLTIFMCRLS